MLTLLCFSRLLGVAAHNLHLVRMDHILIVELEVDILDQERPDFIAEPIRIQVTLVRMTVSAQAATQ